MPFIKTGKSYYIATDYDGRELFKSENYSDLFDFIYADLQPLQIAVKEYVDCILDTTNFSVKQGVADYIKQHHFDEVNKELIKIHPYYVEMYPYPNNLAIDYINDLLIPFPFSEQPTQSAAAKAVLADVDKFTAIVDAVNSTQNRCFHAVATRFGDLTLTVENCLKKHYIKNKELRSSDAVIPTPAQELIFAQNTMLQLFYWVLDLGNDLVSDLSQEHRFALWDELFSFPEFPHIELISAKIYGYKQSPDAFMDKARLYTALSSAHKKEVILSEHLDAQLNSFKNDIKKEAEYFPATYSVNSLLELLMLEFEMLVRENHKLRRCRHCGRYFIIKNLKHFYCSRIARGEQYPCDKIGSRRAHEKYLDENPIIAFYREMYSTKRKQLNRKRITHDESKAWEEAAAVLCGKAKSGELPFEQFKAELERITYLKTK